jgi:segregation and condensation protein B
MMDQENQNQKIENTVSDDSVGLPTSIDTKLPHDSFDQEIRAYTEADLESELAPREGAEADEKVFKSEEPTASGETEIQAEDAGEAPLHTETATEQFYQKCDLPLKSQIEAVLFASQKCLHIDEIAQLILVSQEQHSDVEAAIQELVWEYQQRGGGFRLEPVRGHGFQFRTVAAAAPLMKRMFASRPRPLSRASLETLSIIAYRQPVTRAEIEYIRGVDAGSIIKHLLERNLIACVGRKEEAGRPMLFGTTAEFLQVFNFSSIKDLPSLASFQAASETIAAPDNGTAADSPSIQLATGDFMDHSDETRNLEVSSGLDEQELEGDGGQPSAESDASLTAADLVETSELMPISADHEIEAAASAKTTSEEVQGDEQIELMAQAHEAIESESLEDMSASVEPLKTRRIRGATKAPSFDTDDSESMLNVDAENPRDDFAVDDSMTLKETEDETGLPE